MDIRRCHEILGLRLGASNVEIRKAFLANALKCHPDKNPTRKLKAEEEFKQLTDAYDTLSNSRCSPDENLQGKKNHCRRRGGLDVFEDFLAGKPLTDSGLFDDEFYKPFVENCQKSINEILCERTFNKSDKWLDFTQLKSDFLNNLNHDVNACSADKIPLHSTLLTTETLSNGNRHSVKHTYVDGLKTKEIVYNGRLLSKRTIPLFPKA